MISELVQEKESWKQRSQLSDRELTILRSKIKSIVSNFDKKRIKLLNKIDHLKEESLYLSSINGNLIHDNDSLKSASNAQLVINQDFLKKASKLTAENLRMELTNTNNKTLKKTPYKSKSIHTISSRFNIAKNSLAEKKTMKAVMRIEKPDGGILYDASDYGNTFLTSRDTKSFYTISNSVNFNNEYEEVILTYERNNHLTSGTYVVYIYLEGEQLGKTSFMIK